MRDRLLAGLALLVLCAYSVTRVTRPPRPVPATAPDTVFSAERAMRHVEQIALRPHPMGTADHDRVRDYLLSQLTALGLKPQVQTTTGIGTRYPVAGRVQNVLAWLPGTDSHGKAVLLMAHYDGVEAGPAAGDDGTGTAALLETLRALRARKTPLAHDVIALFTDGEEAGLLGAAAFVREHPWAKDVAMVLNFDVRGTTGRAFMFETGPGNLDVARGLRRVRGASAGSVYTAIYRALPNDTDLSELGMLGTPALNFGFIGGVERYHTSHDDVAHLDAGSVQHLGDQMLDGARVFASETLPRPVTGDAVFFDLPALGLVVYPEGLAIPLAVLAIVLMATVVVRERRGVIAGVVASIVAIAAACAVAFGVAWLAGVVQAIAPWGGNPMWSGVYGSAVVLASVALVLAASHAAKRWTLERGLHTGAMVVWALVSLLAAIEVPGASYLLVWPVVFAALAELIPRARRPLQWIAAVVALLLPGAFAYTTAVIALGVAGVGAVMLGLVASLVAFLLLPVLEMVSGGLEWNAAPWAAAAAAILFLAGAATTRFTSDHPMPTSLVYAENADSADAWFGALQNFTDAWTRSATAPAAPGPPWTARLSAPRRLLGHRVARVGLEAPAASLVRDTVIGALRRVVLRVHAPRGTTSLVLRAPGVRVTSASFDGRVADTTRYRRRLAEWAMPYWAVPDTGAIVALSIPAGAKLEVELIARRPGLPVMPKTPVLARPENVVPIQVGDASYVYRRLVF